MIKKIAAVCLLASSLFGTEIHFTKEFTKTIDQDEVFSYITIFSEKQQQLDSINALKQVMKYIKKDDSIDLKNLNQSTYPQYEYSQKDKKRYLTGYRSTINFNITSDESEKITSYINKLMRYNKNDITINYSNLGWRISKKLEDQTIDSLRLEVLSWTQEYSSELSKSLDMSCKLDSVNFNSRGMIRPLYATQKTLSTARNVALESADVSMPESEVGELTISAMIKYECK